MKGLVTTRPVNIDTSQGPSMNRFRERFPKVKLISDLKTAITIEVTKDDATGAAKRSETDCAMALACSRSYDCEALVSLRHVWLVDGAHAVRGRTTELLRREIVDNDRYKKFAPGVYRISPINPGDRLGVRTNRPKGKGPKTAKPAKSKVVSTRTSWGVRD